MSNTVLLSWDKPTALAQWQKERGTPELTRHLRNIAIGVLVSGILVSAVVATFNYYGTKMSWVMAAWLIVSQNVGTPLLTYWNLRKKHVHTERHYEIRDDGILIISGKNRQLHPWKKIRNYHIEPVPDLPTFKILSFQASSLDSIPPIQLGFDPNQISESKLQALFAQKMGFGTLTPRPT